MIEKKGDSEVSEILLSSICSSVTLKVILMFAINRVEASSIWKTSQNRVKEISVTETNKISKELSVITTRGCQICLIKAFSRTKEKYYRMNFCSLLTGHRSWTPNQSWFWTSRLVPNQSSPWSLTDRASTQYLIRWGCHRMGSNKGKV